MRINAVSRLYKKIGVKDGIRTRDFLDHNQAL